MSSRFITGEKSKALDALPEILLLAKDVLTESKYEDAETVARTIARSKRNRKKGIVRLSREIGNHPRPLLYLWPKLRKLPRYTRDPIRHSGDYLDLLVKEWSYETLGGKARKNSLRANVKKIPKTPELSDLANHLVRYCDFIYTPGKKDNSLPPGWSHKFTSREVVLTVYITAELGKRILLVSENARKAVEDDDRYTISGRWGRSNRLKYYRKMPIARAPIT
jgi:hypothetical protein